MYRRLLIIGLGLLLLAGLALGFMRLSNPEPLDEDKLPPGVILENALDIQTGNPQPAGRNAIRQRMPD